MSPCRGTGWSEFTSMASTSMPRSRARRLSTRRLPRSPYVLSRSGYTQTSRTALAPPRADRRAAGAGSAVEPPRTAGASSSLAGRPAACRPAARLTGPSGPGSPFPLWWGPPCAGMIRVSATSLAAECRPRRSVIGPSPASLGPAEYRPDLLKGRVVRDHIELGAGHAADRIVDAVDKLKRNLIGFQPDGEIETPFPGHEHRPAPQYAVINVPQPGGVLAVRRLGINPQQHRPWTRCEHVKGLKPAGRVLRQQQPHQSPAPLHLRIPARHRRDPAKPGQHLVDIGAKVAGDGERYNGVRGVGAARQGEGQLLQLA